MAVPLHVVGEDLQVSAAHTDVHGENLRVAHAAAHGQIEAAQRGLPGAAAVALSTAVAKWQADSAALVWQLVGHSEALRGGAVAYHQTDSDGAAAVAAAGNHLTELDLGL